MHLRKPIRKHPPPPKKGSSFIMRFQIIWWDDWKQIKSTSSKSNPTPTSDKTYSQFDLEVHLRESIPTKILPPKTLDPQKTNIHINSPPLNLSIKKNQQDNFHIFPPSPPEAFVRPSGGEIFASPSAFAVSRALEVPRLAGNTMGISGTWDILKRYSTNIPWNPNNPWKTYENMEVLPPHMYGLEPIKSEGNVRFPWMAGWKILLINESWFTGPFSMDSMVILPECDSWRRAQLLRDRRSPATLGLWWWYVAMLVPWLGWCYA